MVSARAPRPREWVVVKRVLDGRRTMAMQQAGRSVFHTTSTVAMAGLTLHLITKGQTGIFSIADPRAMTTATLAGTIATAKRQPLTILDASNAPHPIGHTPWSVSHPVQLSLTGALDTGWAGPPRPLMPIPLRPILTAFCRIGTPGKPPFRPSRALVVTLSTMPPKTPLFAAVLIGYSAAMFTVAALYHFIRFADPAALRGPLLGLATANGIKGSLLLATEGINGTIAGTREGIDAVIGHIRSLPGCADLEWKESHIAKPPFGRMKVRLKREIVTMGQPDIDPKARVGHYVAAQDWNALISAPDVAVIDTRNDYEVSIGTFEGAVDPQTRSFGEFPAWWEANKERFQNKRIAMFCTGGIRCEKSTNYLLGQGVPDVFHLKGGILKYLEEVPKSESLWQGQCFVFDERVSVGHGLQHGPHHFCRACRRPLLPQERLHPHYEQGVSCGHCHSETSEADRARYRERQKQMTLAKARGGSHLGG